MKIYKPTDDELRKQIDDSKFQIYVVLAITVVIVVGSFITNDRLIAILAIFFMIMMLSFFSLSIKLDKIRLEIRMIISMIKKK